MNSAFLLLMALYPAAQRKAQDEIETIVGKDRLAVMEDRPRLPYIEALMKEVHRFIPITPLVPHSTRVDDEFRGYRIPKGSWVIANTWCVLYHSRCEYTVDHSWANAGRLCVTRGCFQSQRCSGRSGTSPRETDARRTLGTTHLDTAGGTLVQPSVLVPTC